MLVLQESREGGVIYERKTHKCSEYKGAGKGIITNVVPRNADCKASITWDSGSMASSKY